MFKRICAMFRFWCLAFTAAQALRCNPPSFVIVNASLAYQRHVDHPASCVLYVDSRKEIIDGWVWI